MEIPEWLKHPKWKFARPPIGALLVVFGIFGFLPVVGFWMIPLGLAVLAVDFPAAERANVWLKRKVRRQMARWRKYRARRKRLAEGRPIR